MTLVCRELQYHISHDFSLGPIDHQFTPGTACVILGDNGAGKSSFFRMISGIEDATSGSALWNEKRIEVTDFAYKRSTGYLSQPLELPLWVSAEDILYYIARLRNLDQSAQIIEDAMTLWQIHSYRIRPMVKCSFGMRKRVALAIALLGDPPLLLLDEPFSGLDIHHIQALKSLIKKRCEHNLITVFSTHIIPFACEESNDVLLLSKGKYKSFSQWKHWDAQTRRLKLLQFFDSKNTENSI